WPLAVWRQHYETHPVTRAIAGRLMWRIVTGDHEQVGRPTGDGRFIGVDGEVLEPNADASIRPWHPVHAEAADVQAWRRHIIEREVIQPFKQAFREIYLLTPAEEQTRLYSNRFAAHILHYQQAYALMKQRRWAAKLSRPMGRRLRGSGQARLPSPR